MLPLVATKLEALHTADSKLMCKNSQIFYNSTLRGGYKAGNFTDLGKVFNMSACVRLCCGDKNCDAAFMLEKNCYAVACIKEDLCTPVHAKRSGALISLNPKISYITSRSEEGKQSYLALYLCHDVLCSLLSALCPLLSAPCSLLPARVCAMLSSPCSLPLTPCSLPPAVRMLQEQLWHHGAAPSMSMTSISNADSLRALACRLQVC